MALRVAPADRCPRDLQSGDGGSPSLQPDCADWGSPPDDVAATEGRFRARIVRAEQQAARRASVDGARAVVKQRAVFSAEVD